MPWPLAAGRSRGSSDRMVVEGAIRPARVGTSSNPSLGERQLRSYP